MNNDTTLEREIFWNILFQLEELKKPMKLSEFLSEREIRQDDFFIFLEQSHFFGLVLNMKNDREDHILFPLSWHREFGDAFIEKSEHKEMAAEIQNCIETNRFCHMKFLDQSEKEIFPWRVIFFENTLSVVGEDIRTKQLITIEIDQVDDIEVRGSEYQSLFSRLEVEDFINAMRAVAGSDERLVLKIQCGEDISMPSDLIFLGNPYTTTNQYGDIIWAASVETSIYLFEWLYSIRDKITILDPSSIKNEFDDFCDERKAA
jgi:hypothetical protein